MDEHEFDRSLIAAAFHQAGDSGWRAVNLVTAAQDAGLDLGRVRERFPHKVAVLMRFGCLADQAVLSEAPDTGTPRDRLFDLLMARFDQLQAHRPGMLALLRALRTDPGLALLLGGATLRSMRWMLDAAGVPTEGPVGMLRVQGLTAVWVHALRAWEKDESADMSTTMAAIDHALDRAAQAEAMLPAGHRAAATDGAEPPADPMQGADDSPAVL